MSDDREPSPLYLVNRVEVISPRGREFVQYYGQHGVTFELQDDGLTLKIFTGDPTSRWTGLQREEHNEGT